MQSEPIRASQTDTLADTQLSSTSTQHGLRHELEESSASLLPREDDARISAVTEDPDEVSVSSEGSRRGRRIHPRRLSSSESSQTSSPGHRIEEYERSHAHLRRPSERFTFQIVSSVKDGKNTASIQEFPNGTSINSPACRILLLIYVQRF